MKFKYFFVLPTIVFGLFAFSAEPAVGSCQIAYQELFSRSSDNVDALYAKIDELIPEEGIPLSEAKDIIKRYEKLSDLPNDVRDELTLMVYVMEKNPAILGVKSQDEAKSILKQAFKKTNTDSCKI